MKKLKNLILLLFVFATVDVVAQCDFTISYSPNPGNPLQYGFSHTKTDALNVTWEFGDDSTASFQGGTHTYASSGVYIVCCTIDTCPPVCDTVTIVKTAGINDLTQGVVNVYPNPSSKNVTVDFSLNTPQKLSIALLSSSGTVVLEKEVNGTAGNNLTSIDLEGLTKGVYSVRIIGENSWFMKTVLKL
jgi:PKD repeat protein